MPIVSAWAPSDADTIAINPDGSGCYPAHPQMLPEGIQGAMRPGCLHLSLDFWMRSAADYDAALAAFHRHLRSPPPGSQLPWLTHNTWLYLPDSEVQVGHPPRGRPRSP